MAHGYGWRGMLILGVLPALACVWIRIYVKEPEVWTENKKIQNTTQKQVTLPLFAIFKPKYLCNTFTGCLWMAREFLRLLRDLGHARHLSAKGAGLDAGPGVGPGVLGQYHHLPLLRLLGRDVGTDRTALGADHPLHHRHLPRAALSGTTDPTLFLVSFLLMICFVGGKDALNPGWLSERFPTEVRATAAGFVYHQGAVWGAAVAPVLTYFAVNQDMGFAKPMMYATIGSLIVYVIAVYLGPETKGKVMTADLEVIEAEMPA